MELAVPDTWLGAAPHLLPVLRDNTSPANAWEAGLSRPEARLVRHPVAPFLDGVVVLDRPELRLFVNRGHLEDWSASPSMAWEAALSNLDPAEGLAPWDGADGVWIIGASDGYASSRLLLPGFLRSFTETVRGRPVAFAPDARTLLVTGTEQGLPLEAALAFAWDTFHAAGTPVSCAPYVLDEEGRGFRAWQPGPEHPLVHRVATAHRFFAGHAYRRAQTPLAQHLVDQDRPAWPSAYSLLRLPGGRVISFAALPDGPTLLPQVDLVVLGHPGPDLLDEGLAVPWAVLVEAGLVGPPDPDLSPVRHPADGRRVDPARFRADAVDPRSLTPA
jgi:hypothetical protein